MWGHASIPVTPTFFLQHTSLPTTFKPSTRTSTRTTPMAGPFDPNQSQNLVEVL